LNLTKQFVTPYHGMGGAFNEKLSAEDM